MRMTMSAAVVSMEVMVVRVVRVVRVVIAVQEKRAVVLATGIQQLLVQFNATLAINFPM